MLEVSFRADDVNDEIRRAVLLELWILAVTMLVYLYAYETTRGIDLLTTLVHLQKWQRW